MSVHLTDVLKDASSLAQNGGFTWVVPLSVLVASLVGSLHCVSMCGPIALGFAAERKRMLAYQAGRFISYVGIGALAGGIGQSVLGNARLPWLSQASLAFIAATLIFMGVRTLLGKGFHLQLPGPLLRLSQTLWKRLHLAGLPSWGVSGGAGLLSVFLPCGHLYGFFLGAMATGRWWAGAAFMFAFWLGTVPALGFGATWVRKLLKPGLNRAPRLAGVVLIAAGVFSFLAFTSHVHMAGMDHSGHHSHGPSAAPAESQNVTPSDAEVAGQGHDHHDHHGHHDGHHGH